MSTHAQLEFAWKVASALAWGVFIACVIYA